VKKYIAELIGTFAIVLLCTGAGVIDTQTNGVITFPGIAVVCGLVVCTMIYAFGEISGAHFNPAVTFGFWAAGRFPAREILPYAISQLAGAFLASVTLHFLFPADTSLGTTQPAGSDMQAFILEVIISFLLMLVIINVAKGSKEQGMFAGLAIGAIVLVNVMFAGPVTGGSMNPARSLAPALVSGNVAHLWIYLTAPFAGAIVAAFTWKFLKNETA
jgi:aquaporin NIP